MEKDLQEARAASARLERDRPTTDILRHDNHDRQRYAHVQASPHIVTQESVAIIVERATRIPVQRLLAAEKGQLLGLEQALSAQVSNNRSAYRFTIEAI